MIEGATPHKAKRMEAKLLDCHICSNLAATSHGNQVYHISSTRKEWYFNSACSQHMIGNSCFLIDLQPSSLD